MKEHPEDKKVRLEAEEYAKKHAAEFCAQYRSGLDSLISIYADQEAIDLLRELRERFWAQDWKPSKP